MEKEVVITYETLFEILRREKTREELQKLPENFHEEVKKYLADKKQTMLSISNDQFSEIEQEKTQRQMVNLKKILNDLYERREKKIVSMALNKSRMPKSVIDISTLAENEKRFYELLVSTFNDARGDALRYNLLESQASQEERPKTDAKAVQELPLEQADEQPQEEKPAFKIADSMKKVKFVCDVSQFVGPNLEIYGPFRAEEIAVLPVSVCNVLLNRDKAELDESS